MGQKIVDLLRGVGGRCYLQAGLCATVLKPDVRG